MTAVSDKDAAAISERFCRNRIVYLGCTIMVLLAGDRDLAFLYLGAVSGFQYWDLLEWLGFHLEYKRRAGE